MGHIVPGAVFEEGARSVSKKKIIIIKKKSKSCFVLQNFLVAFEK